MSVHLPLASKAALYEWIKDNQEFIKRNKHNDIIEQIASDLGIDVGVSQLRYMIYTSFLELKNQRVGRPKTGDGFDPRSLIEGYQSLSARLRRVEVELGIVGYPSFSDLIEAHK